MNFWNFLEILPKNRNLTKNNFSAKIKNFVSQFKIIFIKILLHETPYYVEIKSKNAPTQAESVLAESERRKQMKEDESKLQAKRAEQKAERKAKDEEGKK